MASTSPLRPSRTPSKGITLEAFLALESGRRPSGLPLDPMAFVSLTMPAASRPSALAPSPLAAAPLGPLSVAPATTLPGFGAPASAAAARLKPPSVTPRTRYRSIDGSGNGSPSSTINAVGSGFSRLGPARFADGVKSMISGDPNARMISNVVVAGQGEVGEGQGSAEADDATLETLRRLSYLSQRRLEWRIAGGSMERHAPEGLPDMPVKARAVPGAPDGWEVDVSVGGARTDGVARRIVSEAMLLAGEAAARYGVPAEVFDAWMHGLPAAAPLVIVEVRNASRIALFASSTRCVTRDA
jgi:hypothetical protein